MKNKHIEVSEETHRDIKDIAKLEGQSMKSLLADWVEHYKKTAVLRR